MLSCVPDFAFLFTTCHSISFNFILSTLGNTSVGFSTIATAVAFFYGVKFFGGPIQHLPLIIGAMAIGSVIGWIAAKRVQMTQMPQMVALFNGVGGGAAAAVSTIEFISGTGETQAALAATVFTVLVGSVSFTGSVVTFLKLQELMTSRPVVLPAGRFVTSGLALVTVAAAVGLVVSPTNLLLWALLGLALQLGRAHV